MNNIDPTVLVQSLGQIGSTIFFVVASAVLIEVLLYYVLKEWLKWRYALPIMLLAPAAIGLLFLVGYPLFYTLRLSFSNMSLRRFTVERGLTFGLVEFWENIKTVFTGAILQQQTFGPLLFRTFLWTAIQVTFHVTLGLGLAMLLNRPMKLRGLYRTILLFPWAVPQVVAVLAWRGEFNFQYGYFNVVLTQLGFTAVNWGSDPFWNFFAVNLTNIWLGVPFMTVVLLGGLQSIDASYYEAAEMDGAKRRDQFRNITLPLMQPVMTPAIILGVIWTFNNFNIPYFINWQELESSNILVTALFRVAFEYNRYGLASAFALVIFAILIGFTLLYMRITNFQLSLDSGGGNQIRQATVGE